MDNALRAKRALEKSKKYCLSKEELAKLGIDISDLTFKRNVLDTSEKKE